MIAIILEIFGTVAYKVSEEQANINVKKQLHSMLRNDSPEKMRERIDEAKRIIEIEEARLEKIELRRMATSSKRSITDSSVASPASAGLKSSSHVSGMLHASNRLSHVMQMSADVTNNNRRSSFRQSVRPNTLFLSADQTEEMLLL